MFDFLMLRISIPSFHLDPTQLAHVGVHGEVYLYMTLYLPFPVAFLSTNFAPEKIFSFHIEHKLLDLPVGLYPLWT